LITAIFADVQVSMMLGRDIFLQRSWAGWWRCWEPTCVWQQWRHKVKVTAAENWRGIAETHSEQRMCRGNIILIQVLCNSCSGTPLIQVFFVTHSVYYSKNCSMWWPVPISI